MPYNLIPDVFRKSQSKYNANRLVWLLDILVLTNLMTFSVIAIFMSGLSTRHNASDASAPNLAQR
jgi:hypothetical protein